MAKRRTRLILCSHKEPITWVYRKRKNHLNDDEIEEIPFSGCSVCVLFASVRKDGEVRYALLKALKVPGRRGYSEVQISRLGIMSRDDALRHFPYSHEGLPGNVAIVWQPLTRNTYKSLLDKLFT